MYAAFQMVAFVVGSGNLAERERGKKSDLACKNRKLHELMTQHLTDSNISRELDLTKWVLNLNMILHANNCMGGVCQAALVWLLGN